MKILYTGNKGGQQLDNLNAILASNLKKIRKSKSLNLEQTSHLTGISKSMLSQLERGEVNPTISTVYKLSLGLKVPVTAFTRPEASPFFQISKDELEPLSDDDGRYRLYPVFPFQDGQNFEIFYFEFDAGGCHQGNRQIAGTREFITIFEGQLTLELPSGTFTLVEGDSASYNAFDDYRYINSGDKMLKANIVVQYTN